jgi:hypothetical protein
VSRQVRQEEGGTGRWRRRLTDVVGPSLRIAYVLDAAYGLDRAPELDCANSGTCKEGGEGEVRPGRYHSD